MAETREALRARCESAGFTFDSYSPGDGVTRYRFFTYAVGLRGIPHYRPDYFGGNGDYTALGRADALTYIAGRIDGYSHGYDVRDDG